MLLLFIIVPLAVAALMPLLARIWKGLPDILGSATMAFTLGLGLYHIRMVAAGHRYFWDTGSLGLPIKISLAMDGFSLLLLLIISLISLFACIY